MTSGHNISLAGRRFLKECLDLCWSQRVIQTVDWIKDLYKKRVIKQSLACDSPTRALCDVCIETDVYHTQYNILSLASITACTSIFFSPPSTQTRYMLQQLVCSVKEHLQQFPLPNLNPSHSVVSLLTRPDLTRNKSQGQGLCACLPITGRTVSCAARETICAEKDLVLIEICYTSARLSTFFGQSKGEDCAMAYGCPTLKLFSGRAIPAVGLGTYAPREVMLVCGISAVTSPWRWLAKHFYCYY